VVVDEKTSGTTSPPEFQSVKLASKLLMPFARAGEVKKGSGVVLDGTNSSGPGNTT
jgi:hypothetical protein